MDDIISPSPAPKTASEYRAAIRQYLAEMERLNKQIRRDQAETDRLRAQTRAMLTEIHESQFRFEAKRIQIDAECEFENLVLRLENTLLRFERRLPPAPRGSETEEPL